jgi:hypothetical protein
MLGAVEAKRPPPSHTHSPSCLCCAVPGKLVSFAAPSQRMVRRLEDGSRVFVRVLVEDKAGSKVRRQTHPLCSCAPWFLYATQRLPFPT